MPRSSNTSLKHITYERIYMRVLTDSKKSLLRAAALRGQSLTDFIMEAALQTAMQTIQDHEFIRLSSEASKQFSALLQNPPTPNANLKKAAQQYAKRYSENLNSE
jgi:uncharacterized protein (DUF1778 family)